MNSCLWVQWEKSSDPSRYVIDGEFSLYDNTEPQAQAIDILFNSKDFDIVADSDDFPGVSPSFSVRRGYYQGRRWCCIEGNYLEKDADGRNMVFGFISDAKDWVGVCNKLYEYSKKLGRNHYDEDIQCLNSVPPHDFDNPRPNRTQREKLGQKIKNKGFAFLNKLNRPTSGENKKRKPKENRSNKSNRQRKTLIISIICLIIITLLLFILQKVQKQ